MQKEIVKLISFQTFFLINNIGRNIINENNDDEELQFFFKIYQYMIFDLMKFLNISCDKKINSEFEIEKLTKREMFILYNYIIDFIIKKKYLYEELSI